MTTQQIILWACAYLVELVAVIYFTRATARRVLGALVGGASAGLLALGAIALCEGLVASTICLNAILPAAFLPRPLDLAPLHRILKTGL